MIDLSPEEFRRLGYAAIDLIADQLATVRDMPTRQPVPAKLRAQLVHSPLGDDPVDADTLLQRVAEEILAYPMGNNSPRFFAWVNSPPAPLGILADLLAAGHGASVAGGDHSATYVEHGVLNWFKTMFGWDEHAAGLLTSGGSMANLIPLAVMRHVKAQGKMRQDGFSAEGAPMVIYTSAQGHSCIQKAVELLGFGDRYLHRVPVDADYQMDVSALRRLIEQDRVSGLNPVCVVASVGTVNTGAIDPLAPLADLCAEEDLWLHIDGAYGGFGILDPNVAPLYNGIERADSLAIDPHKWLYMPVECGCTLVKDAQAMRDTFSVMPPYLRDDRALPWFSEFGVQQTRGFKALKLWMTLQQVGLNGYRDLIARDNAMARALRARIMERANFEVVSAGPLSITCFRYKPNAYMDDEAVDALNRAIPPLVQASGEAFITTTELDERTVLRACIVNFRTAEADLDRLLDAIERAGEKAQVVA